MIPVLGTFALYLALFTAASLAFAGLTRRASTVIRALAAAHFTALGLAFTALLIVFVTSDFSVATVYNNSHSLKPMIFKLSGAWGNHEGSILLWALFSAGYTAIFARYAAGKVSLPVYQTTLGTLGLVGIGINAYVLFLSSPLSRMEKPYPIDGTGLNPLLQDIGLAIHPPMLYLGYIGLAIPYALAIGALINQTSGKNFARYAKPWTYLAFAFLSFGIMLGSWWAYRELGWGGWWFWDPVENVSLVPWLMAAALAHSLMALKTRDALPRWSLFLAVTAFGSSVLGAFLVRSGLLVSVHAFAADPKRGIAILAYLTAILLGALIVFAMKARSSQMQPEYNLVSRETTILAHNVLASAAAATVVVGTLYPVIIQALNRPLLSVGAPYFHASVIPLLIMALLAMAFGSDIPWRKAKTKPLIKRVLPAAIAGFAVFILCVAVAGTSAQGAMALAAGAALIVTLAVQGKRARTNVRATKPSMGPMILAHLGVAIFALAASASTVFSKAGDQEVVVGQSFNTAGYTVTLKSLTEGRGANFVMVRGDVELKKPGRAPLNVKPEFRYYPVSDMPTTEAVIDSTFLRDVKITINAVERDEGNVGKWAVRVQERPFLVWLWIGVIITVLGILWAALVSFKMDYARVVEREAEHVVT